MAGDFAKKVWRYAVDWRKAKNLSFQKISFKKNSLSLCY